MNVTIEYMPTHENMDYAFELQIDITQLLSMQNLLHLLGPDRELEEISREEDVFEIRADNNVIFSRQTLSRLPNGQEIVNYIVNNS